MKNIEFNGTITAIITPFHEDGSVDFEAFEKLLEFQIENGVNSVVVCGSTGESATLTYKEKQALIIKAVEISKGRIPIIAGTGTNETKASMDLSVLAMEHGADALLLVAPYYNKPPQEGLFEHFKLIADNVSIPVIIYNVPGRTGVNISTTTQLRLAESCKNIVATKEASGDLEQMMEIINKAPDGFHLLSGDDALALPAISIGAKGVISVLSNYAPKETSEMIKTALAGNFTEASKIHYRLFELMQLNFVEPNPIPVKAILSMMGFCKDSYRLPLMPITTPNKKKIKEALIKAGILK